VTASAAQIVTRRRTYPRSRSRIIRFPEAVGQKSASAEKRTGEGETKIGLEIVAHTGTGM
jgi:hypothetical protein